MELLGSTTLADGMGRDGVGWDGVGWDGMELADGGVHTILLVLVSVLLKHHNTPKTLYCKLLLQASIPWLPPRMRRLERLEMLLLLRGQFAVRVLRTH